MLTNYHRRPIIDAWELSAAERAEFDYLDAAGRDSATFVRFRGELYDLHDVARAEGVIATAGWDGFNPDSYWSGMAFKYVNYCGDHDDYVIVARMYW